MLIFTYFYTIFHKFLKYGQKTSIYRIMYISRKREKKIYRKNCYFYGILLFYSLLLFTVNNCQIAEKDDTFTKKNWENHVIYRNILQNIFDAPAALLDFLTV